ncbi:MAG: malto-oligosyltrehalose synthase, partial [Chthoniobacteraceae bacterium]
TINRKHKQLIDGAAAPDANEEYLIYQTLIGSWPLEEMTPELRPIYIRRIQDYMVKALHEAKVNSSWIEPNEAWDGAVREFVAKLLHPRSTNRFVAAFTPLAARVAELGAQNSLSQVALKLTIPGLPDLYQGSELWDLSLVDPDNRRPVDYQRRRQVLDEIRGGQTNPRELLEHWRDGRVKMFVLHTLLQLRKSHRGLFDHGSYAGLTVHGTHARSCLSFTREWEGKRIIVAVPRLSCAVGFPALGERWSDTALETPTPDVAWRNVFSRAHYPAASELRLAEIFADFPLAVLISE